MKQIKIEDTKDTNKSLSHFYEMWKHFKCVSKSVRRSDVQQPRVGCLGNQSWAYKQEKDWEICCIHIVGIQAGWQFAKASVRSVMSSLPHTLPFPCTVLSLPVFNQEHLTLVDAFAGDSQVWKEGSWLTRTPCTKQISWEQKRGRTRPLRAAKHLRHHMMAVDQLWKKWGETHKQKKLWEKKTINKLIKNKVEREKTFRKRSKLYFCLNL